MLHIHIIVLYWQVRCLEQGTDLYKELWETCCGFSHGAHVSPQHTRLTLHWKGSEGAPPRSRPILVRGGVLIEEANIGHVENHRHVGTRLSIFVHVFCEEREREWVVIRNMGINHDMMQACAVYIGQVILILWLWLCHLRTWILRHWNGVAWWSFWFGCYEALRNSVGELHAAMEKLGTRRVANWLQVCCTQRETCLRLVYCLLHLPDTPGSQMFQVYNCVRPSALQPHTSQCKILKAAGRGPSMA